MVVTTIGVTREGVDVDSDRVANGVSDWVARRWIGWHVHAGGDACAL